MGLYSPTLDLYSVSMSSEAILGVDDRSVSPEELDRILKSPKATAEFKIMRATRHLLATDGLGISMEAIADEAGIGRSTIFRHFPSRDELVARALDESLAHFHGQVPRAIEDTASMEEWLDTTVSVLHRMQMTAGRGLWQLAASDDRDLPPPIAKVNKKRRRARHETTVALAQEAWRRSGAAGQPPKELELAFALTFSSFTAHSVNVDYGANEQDTVRMIVGMLLSYLHSRN